MCTGNHYGTDCQFVNDDGDPCLLDHVQNCYGHGTCMYASDGRHNCSCEEGYSSSHECEIIHLWRDICKTDVCQNGGTCSGILNNYSCECPAGKVFPFPGCVVVMHCCSSQASLGPTALRDLMCAMECVEMEGFAHQCAEDIILSAHVLEITLGSTVRLSLRIHVTRYLHSV